jgi:hypothetical protein
MQCGPVRHRGDARVQAAERGIRHRTARVIVRRSLNYQSPWPRPNVHRCQRSMRPWRKTLAGMT